MKKPYWNKIVKPDQPACLPCYNEKAINPWEPEYDEKIKQQFAERKKNQTRDINKIIDSGYRMSVMGNIMVFTAKNF